MSDISTFIAIIIAYLPIFGLIIGVVWAINDKRKDPFDFDDQKDRDELDKY